MGKVVRFTGPYQVEIAEYVERTPGPNEVLLATLYSGISSGTELSHYRGTNPFIHKVQNPATHLFEPVDDAHWFPRSSGYEEVGQVIAVGPEVTGVVVGDVIYGTWQHHSTRILNGALAQRQKLPAGLDPICGIFSQIGAIALNGILDAQINVGETVAVFGQGTPGLIAGQLARLSGATVIAVDLYESRLQLAAALGADHAINAGTADPAEEIRRLTGGMGADVCLELSGSTLALQQAIRSVVTGGKVVALGFYQGEARGLYLGEEFHHNQVQLICSQIGGINPAYSRRWDHARLHQTIMNLQAQGRLRLRELITEVYPYERAAEAYRRLDQDPSSAVQLVLDFRHAGPV